MDSSSISRQLLTVRQSDTLNLCSYHGDYRLSGMISERSKDQCLTSPLISSLGDSPARILALQEKEKAWQESTQDFSTNCVAWSKKSSPLSFSWKTSQPLELEHFEKSFVPLQIFGMTVGGRVYLPKKLEPTTSGRGGFFWPTPTANRYGSSNNGCPGDGRTEYKQKGKPRLEGMARMWPTPRASDGAKHTRTLEGALREAERKGGPQDLPSAVLISKAKIAISRGKSGGKLNPTWVEWLMGLPCGWTELNALGTRWFLSRPK